MSKQPSEQAAEIARLREIVAGVDDGGHWYSQQTMDARVAEIAHLTAELAQCREDVSNASGELTHLECVRVAIDAARSKA